MLQRLFPIGLLLFAGALQAAPRPNILFCIADDWGWPHAGAYGDQAVKTPAFNRLAREGVLFHQAYVSSPSCTPCRNSILTGQWHWRLGSGGNLWSDLPVGLPVYPQLLEDAGYHVGHSRKSYGPGKLKDWKRHPVGTNFKSFAHFLKTRPKDEPFCFWQGSSDPHRGYKLNSGRESGIDLARVHLFKHYPDHEVVRSDVADYYFEVQRFDSLVGSVIAELERIGELDRTLIIVTGDHGMPFPRGKGNLYDSGTRVPLVVRWPGGILKPGRTVDSFVSLTDLAPTFLEVAGVNVPKAMTGGSLLPLLGSTLSGQASGTREEIFFGKERHCPGQEAPDSGGYPCRGIRTHDYLYIRNYEPLRWPAGTPNYDKAYKLRSWFGDCDNGPTKSYIVANKDQDAAHRRSYDLCFSKRPAEELYDLKKDPEQLVNVANNPAVAEVKTDLSTRLTRKLRATGDPREVGGGEKFDTYPYYGGAPGYPGDQELRAYRND
ncbi:MAG: sulfatase [Fuerstiella sp.]|nr:sulfatase [Fuerstiella sp.]MCP4854264.1 sulfatase [Fuerstiella sp.]